VSATGAAGAADGLGLIRFGGYPLKAEYDHLAFASGCGNAGPVEIVPDFHRTLEISDPLARFPHFHSRSNSRLLSRLKIAKDFATRSERILGLNLICPSGAEPQQHVRSLGTQLHRAGAEVSTQG
jgi:hypothetical protein